MFRSGAVFLISVLAAATLPAQAPRIESITPSQGPIAGGTVVTVSGANFTGATLKFDNVATSPVSQSDAAITLQMQAHVNGYTVISVSNSYGTAYGEYLYVPPRLQELAAGYITTVAGVGNYVRTFGPANQAMVLPNGVVYDAAGKLYIAEAGQHRLTRVTTDGNIELFASGNVLNGVADNVPAIGGGVGFPFGVAVDAGGYVYVATHSPWLRRIDPRTGLISTVAGNGQVGFSGDSGPARLALIGQATFVASDGANVFFIDWDNARVRRIDSNGIITTYAGNGTVGNSGDGGPAVNASFNFGTSDFGAIAVDAKGNLYIADTQNGAIRKVDRQSGVISHFATSMPGDYSAQSVGEVRSIAIDRDGNVYYGGSGRIVKRDAQGTFVASWGTGQYGMSPDGPLSSTIQMAHIVGLAVDLSNNIVYADDAFTRVRRLNFMTNQLETIAGIAPAIPNENGPAVAAPLFNENGDLAIDSAGNLLIGDGGSNRTRRLDANGNLQTITGGSPQSSLSKDIPAQNAGLAVVGLKTTQDGGLDIADTAQVGHVDTAGIYHVLGGVNPQCAWSGDGGPFKLAHLCQPWDTARDAAGNLFIADTNNNRIRRIDAATGMISTVAGNAGPISGLERYGGGGYCGDGGPATSACLNTPYGIAVDSDGTIYISENWQRIRRVSPDGTISTFASASVQGVSKIVLGPGGALYGVNHNQAGRFDRDGRFIPLAGTPEPGISGDGGPALQAKLNTGGQAAGLAIDAEGNLYFADAANRRVRAVRYGAVLGEAGSTITASSGSPQKVNVQMPFQQPLVAKVISPTGSPAAGVRVDFSSPASGPSCRFAAGGNGASTVSDANGFAATSCTANDVAGTFSVNAAPLGISGQALFTLTNVASATSVIPQSGWWWDPKLNGTGFFVEYGGKSGQGTFVGGFLYDASGNNTWLVSTGPMSGSTYTSTWLKTSGGQTLLGPYRAPSLANAGNLSITFTDSAHAVMTRPDGTQVNLQRFSFTASPTPAAPEAGAPQSGWWWAGANLSGTGYGIEIQGNGVFIVAYVYDDAGNPVWYLATGTLTTPTSYSGTWDVYAGGPQLTSPEGTYSAHKVSSATAMTLTFSDATHGTLTMGNVVVPIVRFQEF